MNSDGNYGPVPDGIIECAVVIPNRNRAYDQLLTMRFLESLSQSDFPKSYPLYQMIGWGYGSRERGVRDMLKLNPEYILVSDNDIIVPKTWWAYFKKIFTSDPKIGAVGAILRGKGWSPPIQHTSNGDFLYCPNGVSDGFICYRTSALVSDGQINAYGISQVYKAGCSLLVELVHEEPQSYIFKIGDI